MSCRGWMGPACRHRRFCAILHGGTVFGGGSGVASGQPGARSWVCMCVVGACARACACRLVWGNSTARAWHRARCRHVHGACARVPVRPGCAAFLILHRWAGQVATTPAAACALILRLITSSACALNLSCTPSCCQHLLAFRPRCNNLVGSRPCARAAPGGGGGIKRPGRFTGLCVQGHVCCTQSSFPAGAAEHRCFRWAAAEPAPAAGSWRTQAPACWAAQMAPARHAVGPPGQCACMRLRMPQDQSNSCMRVLSCQSILGMNIEHRVAKGRGHAATPANHDAAGAAGDQGLTRACINVQCLLVG